MFGLGFPELIVILVIILVIFGAGRLPQVGEALGKGLSKFRTAVGDEAKADKSKASDTIAETSESDHKSGKETTTTS